MGGAGKEKKTQGTTKILDIDVWGAKGVQMVINKLIRQRYDNEIIIQTLSDLVKIEKWDDTNFISFESFFLKRVKSVKSNETRLSYQLLWKRYLEKKSTHKIGREVSMFSDDINMLLQSPETFASGGRHGGVGALSVGK